MDPETRFSEDEIQKILARAAQNQDRNETSEPASLGLSLARLQEVAADVGISPLHVEAAAREVLLRRNTKSATGTLGLPRELNAVRLTPGQLSDAQWERMVAEFRQIFGKSGIPSQFGPVREWVSTNETNETMPVIVRVEPADGGLRLSVRQSITALSTMVWTLGGTLSGVGAVFGGMLAGGLLQPAAGVFAALMVAAGAAVGGGGWLVGRSWTKQQQERLERAADRAELIVRAGE